MGFGQGVKRNCASSQETMQIKVRWASQAREAVILQGDGWAPGALLPLPQVTYFPTCYFSLSALQVFIS